MSPLYSDMTIKSFPNPSQCRLQIFLKQSYDIDRWKKFLNNHVVVEIHNIQLKNRSNHHAQCSKFQIKKVQIGNYLVALSVTLLYYCCVILPQRLKSTGFLTFTNHLNKFVPLLEHTVIILALQFFKKIHKHLLHNILQK